jgi:hypothetical protein
LYIDVESGKTLQGKMRKLLRHTRSIITQQSRQQLFHHEHHIVNRIVTPRVKSSMQHSFHTSKLLMKQQLVFTTKGLNTNTPPTFTPEETLSFMIDETLKFDEVENADAIYQNLRLIIRQYIHVLNLGTDPEVLKQKYEKGLNQIYKRLAAMFAYNYNSAKNLVQCGDRSEVPLRRSLIYNGYLHTMTCLEESYKKPFNYFRNMIQQGQFDEYSFQIAMKHLHRHQMELGIDTITVEKGDYILPFPTTLPFNIEKSLNVRRDMLQFLTDKMIETLNQFIELFGDRLEQISQEVKSDILKRACIAHINNMMKNTISKIPSQEQLPIDIEGMKNKFIEWSNQMKLPSLPNIIHKCIVVLYFHPNIRLTEQGLKYIQDSMSQYGNVYDQSIYNIILEQHALRGDVKSINETIEQMKERKIQLDAMTYQMIIFGYVNKRDEGALTVLESMASKKITPTPLSYVHIFKLLNSLKKLPDAVKLFKTLEHPAPLAYNYLLILLLRVRQPILAEELVQHVDDKGLSILPSLVTTKEYIQYYKSQGNLELAGKWDSLLTRIFRETKVRKQHRAAKIY